MKIKHFAGYGSVHAVKVKDSAYTLHVKVVGNHEWGVCRRDDYDVFNWLVKRFDKSFADYNDFKSRLERLDIASGYENGVETCDYMLKYKRAT